MIPEIGHFSLIIAFALALVQSVLPLVGSLRGSARLMAVAKPAAQGQFVFVALSFGCLAYAFLSNDFSLVYVANNSNSMLPAYFRLGAVWGGHEGSMLLWTMILALWTLAVTMFSRRLPEEVVARVLSVMGMIAIGLMAFILFTSNPFERLLPAALDGRDLNPLLQDPGMVFHPPVLYMGYVGFSVAFSFAIAALIGGRLDATWARWSRPWTTVAWIFLTLGIVAGSWWAYNELGWGGWWFWDPVENASFMPWLVGTALIHSLAGTEKRGSFKNWTVLLAICAFSLSLLGTFLVRSGVLTSVHAFTTDPSRGLFILIFLGIVIGGSLTLFAWRAPKVGLGGDFELVSRESMLLVNNVLLVTATGAVMLGTLYPLVLDVLGLGKISVGPPYFDAVFAPIMIVVAFLMGLGPFARWKKASIKDIAMQLRWWLLASVLLGLVVPWLFGRWSAPIIAGIAFGAWAILASVAQLVTRLRSPDGSMDWSKLRTTSRSTWGMLVAHAGIGVFIVGVTMVKGFEITSEVRMRAGDTATVGGYVFRFAGLKELKGPNYMAVRAALEVTKNGGSLTMLYPEKRMYTVQRMPMTESDVDSSFFRDLYVALGEAVSAEEWIVRIQYKPMVAWIWGGCLLMALGGLLAVSDRRYRTITVQKRQPADVSAAIAVAH